MSAKIKLQLVDAHNLGELFEMWNNPEFAGDYVEFPPKSWTDFQEFVKGACFFLIEKPDLTTIGWISYYWTRTDYPYLYEIGYSMNPAERNNGYMTEAVRQIVSILFSTKNIERIEAVTDILNLASQKVLEKNGFQREGELRKRSLKNGQYRNEFICGILREDWEGSLQ